MLLLFDIGNTHTHIGISRGQRVRQAGELPTGLWRGGEMLQVVCSYLPDRPVTAAALCSVVPGATAQARRSIRAKWEVNPFELTARSLRGVGINYPKPETIGPDRLANAVAVRHRFGAPALVVDFGTAVTFDVVDRNGDYAGGIIAPGLSAMTSYLYEKTALLPRIKIREVNRVIGKTTEQAMLIGAVHGYRGLIRELIVELRRELNCRRLPIVATGGYAKLLAAKLPEITAVDPLLTLEGLRLAWEFHRASKPRRD